MADAGHWSDLDRSGSTIYQHATTNALSVRTTPGASAASRTRVIFHREGFLVGIVTVIANAVVAQLYRRNLILNILNINVIYQLSTEIVGWFYSYAWARHWRLFRLTVLSFAKRWNFVHNAM